MLGLDFPRFLLKKTSRIEPGECFCLKGVIMEKVLETGEGVRAQDKVSNSRDHFSKCHFHLRHPCFQFQV